VGQKKKYKCYRGRQMTKFLSSKSLIKLFNDLSMFGEGGEGRVVRRSARKCSIHIYKS
jgi:hypothetical protein